MEHSGLFFGAAYYIDGVSPEQIREDLAAMQAAGMNFVRLQGCCWQSWEPERGRYSLEELGRSIFSASASARVTAVSRLHTTLRPSSISPRRAVFSACVRDLS